MVTLPHSHRLGVVLLLSLAIVAVAVPVAVGSPAADALDPVDSTVAQSGQEPADPSGERRTRDGTQTNQLEHQSAQRPDEEATSVATGADGAATATRAASADHRLEWTYEGDVPITSAPTVVGGTVFATSEEGAVVAVDAGTGIPEWTFEEPDRTIYSAPTVVDGTVYVDSRYWDEDAGERKSTLHALDADTGTEIWSLDGFGNSVGSHVVDDGMLYGTGGGDLYAVDITEGRLEWVFESGTEDVWHSPAVANGTVFVGTLSGSSSAPVYAVDAETGEEEWSYETYGDDINVPPTVTNGTVYVGTFDGRVVALDGATGEEEWTFAASHNRISSAPTVDDGTVYFGAREVVIGDLGTRHQYAVDADTGDQLWYTERDGSYGESAPTVADDTLYVGGGSDWSEGALHAIDADTGAVEWKYDRPDDLVSSSPTVVDGTVFVADLDGALAAFDADHTASSEGSRVALGTFGHHHGSIGGSGDVLSVEVVDVAGDPIADASVRVETGSGTVVGESSAVDDGLDLSTSPGEYTVVAEADGETRTRTVQHDWGNTTAAIRFADCGDRPFVFGPGDPDTTTQIEFVPCETADRGAQFDFGDGHSAWVAPGDAVTHSYDENGTFDVEFATVDRHGNATQIGSRSVSVERAAVAVRAVETDRRGTPLASPDLDLEQTYAATVVGTEPIEHVAFRFDGEEDAVLVSEPPYERSVDVAELDGVEFLEVTATDASGETHTRTITPDVTQVPDWLDRFAGDPGEMELRTTDGEAPVLVGGREIARFDEASVDSVDWFPVDTATGIEYRVDSEATYRFADASFAVHLDGTGDALVAGRGLGLDFHGTGYATRSQFHGGRLQGELRGHLPQGIDREFDVGPNTVEVTFTPTPYLQGLVVWDARNGFTVRSGYLNPGVEFDATTATRVGPMRASVDGKLDVGADFSPAPPPDTNFGAYAVSTVRAELSAFFLTYDATLVEEDVTFGTVQSDRVAGADVHRTVALQALSEDAEWSVARHAGQQPTRLNQTARGRDRAVGLSTTAAQPRERSVEHRLTDRGYVDTEPDVGTLRDGHLVAWSAHRSGEPAEAGRDIAVASLTDGLDGDVEPTYLTGPGDASHHDPTIATDGETAIVAWTTVEADGESADHPSDLAEHAQISYALYDGDEWSESRRLTDSAATDVLPTVTAAGEGWMVAWESADGLERWSDSHDVAFAHLDENGSEVDRGRLHGLSEPEITEGDDGVDVLAIDVPDTDSARSSTGVSPPVRELAHARLPLDGGEPETVTTHEVANYDEHAARDGAFVWTAGNATDPEIAYVADAPNAPAAVEEQRLGDTSRTVDQLDVLETDHGPVLTYRRPNTGSHRDEVAYRTRSEDGWSDERRLAAVPEEYAIESTASVSTEDGLGAISALTEQQDGAVPDLFAGDHEFRPDFRVAADVSPEDVGVGDRVTVSYELENVGDVPARDPVSVELRSKNASLDVQRHDAVDVGAVVEGTLNGTVDRSGTLLAVADPADEQRQLDPATGRTELSVLESELAVADVEQHRSETGATLNVTVENRGDTRIPAADLTLSSVDADVDVLQAGTTPAIPPGETASASVELNESAATSLEGVSATIEVDGGGATVTRPLTLLPPDVAVREPTTYERTADGVRASLQIENAGAGPAEGVLRAVTTANESATGVGTAEQPNATPSSGRADRTIAERPFELAVPTRAERETRRIAVDLPELDQHREIAFVATTDVPDRDPTTTVARAAVPEVSTGPAGALEAEVTSAHGGDALANATLVIDDGTYRVESGADGSLETSLSPGNYSVIVRAPHHAPAGTNVSVAAGHETALEVELEADGPAPQAVLRVDGAEEPGAPVSIDASDSLGPIEAFEWRFDDGTAVTTDDPTATHAYDEPGTYQVTLTVVGPAGRTDSAHATVSVENADELEEEEGEEGIGIPLPDDPSRPEPDGEPNLQLRSLETPDVVAPGAAVDVTVRVSNDGDADGTAEVVVDADGTRSVRESVSVDAGEERTVTLPHPGIEAPGTYEVTAAMEGDERVSRVTVSDSDRVEETAEDEERSEDRRESEPTDDSTPGFGLVAALLAIAVGLLGRNACRGGTPRDETGGS